MSQESKKKEQSQREGGRPSRRVLSAEKKYQIFLEAQREEKSAAEVLRREGLYLLVTAHMDPFHDRPNGATL